MLSRSAERLYWLARYLERTENIARLVSVHMNLLMDLPNGVEMGWQQLVRINASSRQFYEKYTIANERNVTRFLLTDAGYMGSLFSSLSAARENIRTSRDLLPDEAWEQVNEMYLFVRNHMESVHHRSNRIALLDEILKGCQRFTGLLSGYMSHNHPYRFIRLGKNIERADMTSRILDLASLLLAESRSDEMRQYETILWVNILKSLNAQLMYRQQVRSSVNGDDVLNFLLLNTILPRSVGCCIAEIAGCINDLPNNDTLPEELVVLGAYVQAIDTRNTTQEQLRDILDDLQNKLGELHDRIAHNWFMQGVIE
ncbi:alpha-E domain-containing protein [Methylobacter sp. Wu8]|uniref:Putative alpha-E superfamily protein n=1 Tax=Methylobacter tundripaludum TaxID=173365 RepID=A0A2S6H7K1_9GAMM|nr:alpha-E domain-containing protein [Methylobacter tundripaludum]MCK9635326.1 alpha-E domain-containing protein [Methylobacter tundripaludum]PPK73393.1 putative alpha-E superfamily protein [Methylobacter tundripaludum]